MSGTVLMKWFREASPGLKARIAGVLFLLLVLTAALTEFFAHGRLSSAADLAAGIIEVSCMIAVTLLFYDIFWPVNKRLSLLAAISNFVGLTLELFQFLRHGVNIGLGFHGFYWILIGYLIFRSTFLPRILGALMAIAGLCWLTYLSPPLANYLSPYILASVLLVEGFAFLWLLVFGLNEQGWKEQANAARASISTWKEPTTTDLGALQRSVEEETTNLL
jgi:Domain of unknown function (DUF4386)